MLVIAALLIDSTGFAQNRDFDNLTHHGPVFPFEYAVGEVAKGEIAINPNRPYYDIVIMDIDRWELCLNLNRARYHCNSYTGHLWYQAGSFIFEGTLSGNYNHQIDLFSCTALDSGWDRGHILYAMQYVEGTNDLYGSFTYFEFPRRTNGINAWLEQGQMGPHIYGTSADSELPPAKPSSFINPKREAEDEDDE